MQPEQQRILGYFIEEAKEHLATLENGLLNLQAVVDDTELMNEVFRAAHSIKGGAAMLGIHSMQHVSHRLEDYFKVLKDHPVKVDQRLEALFLKGFDALRLLTDELQNTLSLSDELSHQTLEMVEPAFVELQAHLSQLTGVTISEEATPTEVVAMHSEEEVAALFTWDVMEQLRVMLGLFQTEDYATTRESLQEACAMLGELGAVPSLAPWQGLIATVSDAIAEPTNALGTLAAVTLPELKTARDRILDGDSATIEPSSQLLKLVPRVQGNQVLESMDWLSLFGNGADQNAATSETTDSVESFLDELLQEPSAEPQAAEVVEVAELEPITVDFNYLTALLAETSEPAAQPLEAQTTTAELENAFAEADAEAFSDLEQMLEESQRGSTVAQSAGAAEAAARAGRRTGVAQTMKVAVKQLDNLSNLIGELVINRNTLEDNQERLRQFLDNLLFQVQQLGDLGQQMQDLYERSLLERSLLGASKRVSSVPTVEAPTGGHASGFILDDLEMDSFTSFHSLAQETIERIVRVREAASDIEFVVDSNEQVTRMFRQVTTQVQEGLTKSRMIPFSQTAERLPRAVRDVSLQCGKQARLELDGRDTLIDKGILERIYDPLTHLVNNAIYHGIESPEVRQSLGKPAEGVIKIRVFYQGNQTIISVSDDGAGINIERVKAKAVEKGLITPQEAANMSKQEAYGLLFQSGFSTNDQTDQLAGRGVGMDVVRSYISELRGVINTDSTPNLGTTFTIRLPLTLSITKALCCVHQNYSIAFPIDGVEDVIDLAPEQLIKGEGDQPFVMWRDRRLPCKPLVQLLAYNRTLKRGGNYLSPTGDKVSVIILRSGDDFIGLQVDEVLGEQEIVIKQLAGPVPKPLGISGVTVQGDGLVMPIADVLELVELSLDRLEVNHQFWKSLSETPTSEVQSEPMVLIVDDSITVRELLSMTFSKAGYRVEQARDGLEAWEKLRSGLPCDLIFCDVEMPRMDGLELLSRLQQDPDLQDLPIAMLTSRGASKHKKMAADLGAKGYFTKPYLEEVLLDAAQRMINGEVLVK
jgi:chemotaxis protein histidine kinase CheA/ActR/RegA family two-component response regulator